MKLLIFCLSLFLFLFEQTNSATIISDEENEPKLGIHNGDNAPPNEGKHAVEILVFGQTSCGGSLIDSTTVISAAHCVSGMDASVFTIRYGTHKLSYSQYEDISVKWTKIHPNYFEISDTWNQRNDISIFKLSKPVKRGKTVKFIDLPQDELKNTPGPFTLYGFGTTDINRSKDPEDLQKMTAFNVTELEYRMLQKKYTDYNVPGTLLARASESAPCAGDSGSGLIYRNKLTAVVSGGFISECYPGKIELFARVDLPENLKFIQRNRH